MAAKVTLGGEGSNSATCEGGCEPVACEGRREPVAESGDASLARSQSFSTAPAIARGEASVDGMASGRRRGWRLVVGGDDDLS